LPAYFTISVRRAGIESSPASTAELTSRTRGIVWGSMNSLCAVHSPAIAAASVSLGTTTGFIPGVLGIRPSSPTAKPPSTGCTAATL
jgi:hypothetical protein